MHALCLHIRVKGIALSANYMGISLSVVGKVCRGILIERIRNITYGAIGEEQCGFRDGRGCVDQIYAHNAQERLIGFIKIPLKDIHIS